MSEFLSIEKKKHQFKMPHRQNFERNTKNYKTVTTKLEERIKEIIGTLMEERNDLNQELLAKNAQLCKLEANNSQAENTIALLREQLCSAKEKFSETNYFAKGVLDIAQKLANENAEIDVTDYSQMIEDPLLLPTEQGNEPNIQQCDSQIPAAENMESGHNTMVNDSGDEVYAEEHSITNS